MAEEYPVGKNRIFYRATAFKEGLDVKVNLLCPNLDNHKDIDLIEFEEGIYYFDYDFRQEGVWVGVFFENGDKKTSQNFRIRKDKVRYIYFGTDQIIGR